MRVTTITRAFLRFISVKKRVVRHNHKHMLKSTLPVNNIPGNLLSKNLKKPSFPDSLKKPAVFIPLIIIGIIYLGLNVWIFFYSAKIARIKLGEFATTMNIPTKKPPQSVFNITPPLTLKPSIIPLKPDDGTKGTYMVSMGKHTGPVVSKIIFDPLDVQKGQTLVVVASIKNDVTVKEVKGTLQTDHGKLEAIFSRIDGSDTNGSWKASFKLNDTVSYTYILTISAQGENGKSEVTTAPRS
jgi:hypothetical protein